MAISASSNAENNTLDRGGGARKHGLARWPSLIAEAERRGYLEFEQAKVRYNCAAPRQAAYDAPEEPIRAAVYSWLIVEKEYPAEAIKIEVKIPQSALPDRADIVVYTDESCTKPYLVVETERPTVSRRAHRQAVGRALCNANSLGETVFALVDSGDRSVLYGVGGHLSEKRGDNALGDRDDLPRGYDQVSEFALRAGDEKNDIGSRSIGETENRVRRAHALIWAGGKRDPLRAFEEWCKLLFAKVYDERHTLGGAPRRFQIGRQECDVSVANRVRALYADACRGDPTVFSEALDLPDDKIVQVVRSIQSVAFTRMDVDSLGAAFEGFFGSVFRGELGQYFTRREICRFVCALLEPTDRDMVLDPTAGSGGFLLETLMQVWRHIERVHADQPDQQRRRYDFASKNLHGIEIHSALGRICKTNLMLHGDGHANIEVDRSCLDRTFTSGFIDADRPSFSLIVGNPPFGDRIEKGDRDHLGSNRLDYFELPCGDQVSSEIVILERAVRWLIPGSGRLGMVIPDGLLNNSGESSRCPALRRYLFRETELLAIVSLPDHAFRRSGAQNKTSALFVRRRSRADKARLEKELRRQKRGLLDEGLAGDAVEDLALQGALQAFDYPVFLAEAEAIGFTSTGASSHENDLYRHEEGRLRDDPATILGQYRRFAADPPAYPPCSSPPCAAIAASLLYGAHRTRRIDPKYHLFELEQAQAFPKAGLSFFALGALLSRRKEIVIPESHPDTLFRTITLTQKGELTPREAGKGNNPPDWRGAYFRAGQRWYRVRCDDILISRIDLWKGCIGVVPAAFDGGIVTGEFPVYRLRAERCETVDVRYLQLVLRTSYFRRALRAITTGHSNRRRIQENDFLGLKVPLPEVAIQREIVGAISACESLLGQTRAQLARKLAIFDELVNERITECRLAKLLTD